MNQGSILRQSLKILVNQRFSVLSHKLKHTKPARHLNPYSEAINAVLLNAIRQEVLSTFKEVFGGDPKPGGGVPGADNGTGCGCCSGGGIAPGATPPYPGAGGCYGFGQMESSIDQMVAESLMHGRQTAGVLRALFGLVPLLIGR